MIEFIKNLQFIFMPEYWDMNYEYDKDIDELFKELLDKFEFERINQYRCKLGPVMVWVGNAPYACMIIQDYASLERLRPSRLTIKRALKMLPKINDKFQDLDAIRRHIGTKDVNDD